MFLFEPSCWAYAGLAALAILALAASLRVGQRPKDYPPGPPTIPILGNLHQIPSEKRHLQFEKWAQEYGPIYSLILGTKTMIVLNSDAAIRDLIDKKGAIYSSRPEAYIAQDVLSGGLRILFMVYVQTHNVLHRFNSTDCLSLAKRWCLDIGPENGTSNFGCFCGTNIRTLSRSGK